MHVQERLEAIDGVGPATAEALRELGYLTPREVAIGYLTIDGPAIADALYATDGLHRHILDSDLTNEDIGVDNEVADYVGMLLFAREVDVSTVCLNDTATRSPPLPEEAFLTDGIVGEFVRPEDIGNGRLFVASVDRTRSYGPSPPSEEYEQVDSQPAERVVEAADDEVKFVAGDTEVLVNPNLMAPITRILDVDPLTKPSVVDVLGAKQPVRLSTDGVNAGWVAPRY